MSDKPTPKRRTGPGALEGTRDAVRTGALLLEMLAGLRGPQETAEAMGVSQPRLYQLEAKALQAMIDALEPCPRGPKADPSKQVQAIELRCKKLETELRRYQALHRNATRSLNLPSPSKKVRAESKGEKTVKRRRRKTARAERVAQGLRVRLDLEDQPEKPAASETGG